MEHTVHLAAKAFIEELNTAARKKRKKSNNDEDEDEETPDWDDDEFKELVDFVAGDVLGKVLGFVNQVSLINLWW